MEVACLGGQAKSGPGRSGVGGFSVGIDEFWQDYCRDMDQAGPVLKTTAFGDGQAQQDELCALVLDGRKRATATLAFWYGYDRELAPRPGDRTIILDGLGAPRGVIETIEVFEAAFCDVDARFAEHEGEGDGSLAYWKAEHRRFFAADLAREGLAFAQAARVICERFRLVWVPCRDRYPRSQ